MQKVQFGQESGFYLYRSMDDVGLFERYVVAANVAVTFRGLGGECDEFMRFLQLEWESYADEPSKEKLKKRFYRELRNYVNYGTKHNWRDSFGSRDFNDLLV